MIRLKHEREQKLYQVETDKMTQEIMEKKK